MGPLRKPDASGKGQSKDYLFINLTAHYFTLSVIARPQTVRPPGVDATIAKRRKSHHRAAAIAGEASST